MRSLFSLALLLATLAACSPPEQAVPSPATTEQSASLSIEQLKGTAKGISIGNILAARSVYVFFDPQCPHCSTLWNSAAPLKDSYRFIWVPAPILGLHSVEQAKTLLAAGDKAAELLADNEKIVSSGGRGIVPEASAQGGESGAATLQDNVRLLKSLFPSVSVPAMAWEDASTGKLRVHKGAPKTTEELRAILDGTSNPRQS